MTGSHEQATQSEEPLSEAELVRRYGGLYADNLLYVWANRFRALTEQELQQMAAIKRDISDLTVGVLPRIISGEVTRVGIETIPESPDFLVTLFNGKLRIPVSIDAVEQNLPQVRDLLSGK